MKIIQNFNKIKNLYDKTRRVEYFLHDVIGNGVKLFLICSLETRTSDHKILSLNAGKAPIGITF